MFVATARVPWPSRPFIIVAAGRRHEDGLGHGGPHPGDRADGGRVDDSVIGVNPA